MRILITILSLVFGVAYACIPQKDLAKVDSPTYWQVYKTELKPGVLPVAEDLVGTYSNFPPDSTPTLEKPIIQKIFMGTTIKVKPHQSKLTLIVHPVLDLQHGYVSRVIILGYTKEPKMDYLFYLGLELISSKMLQNYDSCGESYVH